MFIWLLLSTSALAKWQQCFTSNSPPPLLCSIIILLFIICSIMMLPVGYYLCCFSFALPMRIWLNHLKLFVEFCVTAEPDFLFPRNDIICLLVREKHSKEYCAMYDICGERSDGKALNCPYGSPSVTVDSFWIVMLTCASKIILRHCFYNGFYNIICLLVWWAAFCQNSKFVSNTEWKCLLLGGTVWNVAVSGSASKGSFIVRFNFVNSCSYDFIPLSSYKRPAFLFSF